MNEEAIARVGLQRKKRKASPLISFFINKQLLYGSHMCTCFSAVHYVHHGTLVLKVWPFSKIKKKSKAISGQALKVPERRGSQISWQSAHEGGKVVRTRHRPPLPPGNVPGTHFYYRLNRLKSQSAAGNTKSMKTNDTIGNLIRYLPACGAVPKSIVQPRTTFARSSWTNFEFVLLTLSEGKFSL